MISMMLRAFFNFNSVTISLSCCHPSSRTLLWCQYDVWWWRMEISCTNSVRTESGCRCHGCDAERYPRHIRRACQRNVSRWDGEISGVNITYTTSECQRYLRHIIRYIPLVGRRWKRRYRVGVRVRIISRGSIQDWRLEIIVDRWKSATKWHVIWWKLVCFLVDKWRCGI